jgi:hypothetical protein
MLNPFLEKAQKVKARRREIMAGHVRGLEMVARAFSDRPEDDPIRVRIEARLEEARQIAREDERQ